MLRPVFRLASALVHLGHGLFLVNCRFPSLTPEERVRCVQWWSARMLHRMGVGLKVHGEFDARAKLVVSNHISWLDILAINAVAPARFVSRAAVKGWPLLGKMVTAGGTLYIERERTRDTLKVLHEMAAAIGAGDTVAVFPESTTGYGEALLPFHANLFQAAISAGAPVQAVALRYQDAQHAISPAASYVGDTTLLQSAWAILRARQLRVHVTILAPCPSLNTDRRSLSDEAAKAIDAALTASLSPRGEPSPEMTSCA